MRRHYTDPEGIIVSKKKKHTPPPPQPAPQNRQRSAPPLNWRRIWPLTLLTAGYFLAITLGASSTVNKVVAMLMLLCTLGAGLLGGKALAGRLNWLFLAAAAWVTMNGVSTLYAVSGKFALSEFLKLATGFGLDREEHRAFAEEVYQGLLALGHDRPEVKKPFQIGVTIGVHTGPTPIGVGLLKRAI